MKRRLSMVLALFLLTTPVSSFAAGEAAVSVVKGRIVDCSGEAVEGGEVFVYDSRRTRRAADFISSVTGRDGIYRIVIPPGKYWVVARVRSGEKLGPMSTGGRHSGEAQGIEAAAGGETIIDFTVADVREMARGHRRPGEECSRVHGRIIDQKGKAVQGAYAFAQSERQPPQIPDFLSPWNDEDGRYSLFLPPGIYCIGATRIYPPEVGAACSEMVVGPAEIGIAKDIQLNYSDDGK